MPIVGEGRPQPQKSVNPASNPPEQRVDKTIAGHGPYEVTPETKFSINVYLKEMDGRWILSAKNDPKARLETVTFRMWTYAEMIDLRKRCSSFDQINRIHTIDYDFLNRLKIQKLMLSWTFGETNHRLAIHHVNGVMTDESWNAITMLSPNIITYIIDMMNSILEG